MHDGGALHGVRVLDLSDEKGRLAGKLLAELGADVLRLRRGVPGAALPGLAGARGGVLDWWHDGGVRRLPLDLDRPDDRDHFRALVARADLLVETEPPNRLARLGIDYDVLRACNPRLVHVSLTPFGRRGPRAGWQASDLVASALGGALAVSGLPDQPLNGWGRQAFNVGGYYAAIAGLAALYAARETGTGQHVDLSLQQAVMSCTEQVLMYWFFREKHFPGGLAGRQGSLHWTGLYEVMPCRTGHAMVTPAPNPLQLFGWMTADGMAEWLADQPVQNLAEILARAPEVMALIRDWAATKDAHELFEEGQRRRMPIGELLDVAEAAENPQYSARAFFRPVAWNGPPVRVPGPFCRPSATPCPPAAPPPERNATVAEVLAAWPPRTSHAGAAVGSVSGGKPLAGVRVLDFTWVLAGPMGTRVLGDLGADVIKLQTEERAQGTNSNEFPYFLMWNRSKRSATLNMKHPQAVAVFRQLVARADVVIDNFAPGVLDRWGAGYAQARAWNPRIIYVAMSGCGQDGPWRNHVTYAPTIHALCGLTSLTNFDDRRDIGLGYSLCDHASGLAGALAVLAALDARRRTGEGQAIDLAQLEVGAHLVGPAFVQYLATGDAPSPIGNRDAFEDFVPNQVYRCPDGWLAVTARTDAEWTALSGVVADPALRDAAELRTVEGRRANRAHVDARLAAWCAGQPADTAMRTLQAHGVPAGLVQTAQHLAECDEQLAARDWVRDLPHESFGRQMIDRFPADFEAAPLDPYTASPFLGQHTFEVYADLLGMSVEAIAAAISDGVFV